MFIQDVIKRVGVPHKEYKIKTQKGIIYITYSEGTKIHSIQSNYDCFMDFLKYVDDFSFIIHKDHKELFRDELNNLRIEVIDEEFIEVRKYE